MHERSGIDDRNQPIDFVDVDHRFSGALRVAMKQIIRCRLWECQTQSAQDAPGVGLPGAKQFFVALSSQSIAKISIKMVELARPKVDATLGYQ